VRKKKLGINEAGRLYVTPSRTHRRRIIQNSIKKLGIDPYGILGYENELRLVKHIKRLETSGFAPMRTAHRALAYSSRVKLWLQGKFNKDKKVAGYDWFRSFMQRHPDLSVRQAEGFSTARAQAVNRENVQQYIGLLKDIMI
jgi:hypothetical protein